MSLKFLGNPSGGSSGGASLPTVSDYQNYGFSAGTQATGVTPDYVDLGKYFNISPSNVDNASEIMAAAQAMSNANLKGRLPAGIIPFKEQLIFGDGTSTALSTWSPYIVGAGVTAENGNPLAGTAQGPQTTLQWTGGSGFGNPLVVMQGPFQGWEFSNIVVDGNIAYAGSPPSLAMQLISAQSGKAEHVTLMNTKSGRQHTTVGVKKIGTVGVNCSHNRFIRCNISFTGSTTVTYGVQYTEGSGAGGNGNCCYEYDEGLWIAQNTGTGGVNPRYGVYFQRCDTVRIHTLNISNGGLAASICYDYSTYNVWPAGTVIDGSVELGGANCPVYENGAPAQSTSAGGAAKHIIATTPSMVNGVSPDPSIVQVVSSDTSLGTGGTLNLTQNVAWGDKYLHGEATLNAGVKNITCHFASTGYPVEVFPVTLSGTPGTVVGTVSANGNIKLTSYQADGATTQTADTSTYYWRLIK